MDKNVDIIGLSNEIIDLIKKKEMTTVHVVLALKAVELSLNEQFIKDTMEDHKQEKQGLPGVN
jgi:hypothetical protein